MKFYTTGKQSNMHFSIRFCWNAYGNDRIMQFQPIQPPFLSVRVACRIGCKRTGSI